MDLDKIGKKIDEVLAEETSESLSKWLKNKRNVAKRHCLECEDDITDSKYLLICEHCRVQENL